MTDAALSPELERFVGEMPTERRPILALMREASAMLPAGARVLDAGAGRAPYRELFAHCEYVTADWEMSMHAEAREADLIGPLDAIPAADRSFDAVINTQVLEHVANPWQVAAELLRVLVPGGHLWLTAPLVWPVHEEPWDFWRYTSHGLCRVLEDSGFEVERIEPRGGYFNTLATLLAGAPYWTSPAPRHEPLRRALAIVLRSSAPLVRRLDGLDGQRTLTLGYACVAVRPE